MEVSFIFLWLKACCRRISMVTWLFCCIWRRETCVQIPGPPWNATPPPPLPQAEHVYSVGLWTCLTFCAHVLNHSHAPKWEEWTHELNIHMRIYVVRNPDFSGPVTMWDVQPPCWTQPSSLTSSNQHAYNVTRHVQCSVWKRFGQAEPIILSQSRG